MKFASGFEILEYAQTMAERLGSTTGVFSTATVERRSGMKRASWTVHTDRDAMKARLLSRERYPDRATARRDRWYGTYKGVPYVAGLQCRSGGQARRHHRHGCDGCTVIPEISKVVGELYVFQRTPSSLARINGRLSRKRSEQWKTERIGR